MCFLGAACATVSPEQQRYLDGIAREPLTFRIPKAQDEEAWGRAQSFLGGYSSMRLPTVTDYVLQTYNPAQSQVDFGYNVTKTPIDARTAEIDVSGARATTSPGLRPTGTRASSLPTSVLITMLALAAAPGALAPKRRTR